MDKHYVFKTINSMLSRKHKFTLSFGEEARALICKCDSEQMYKILFSLYATKRTDEEFVKYAKKRITAAEKETKRVIGFELQRD